MELEICGKELLKSLVGIDKINVINTCIHPLRSRGEQDCDRIDVYARQCQNKLVFSKTIVHEMTHYRFDIWHCQHAEAICFAIKKCISNAEIT